MKTQDITNYVSTEWGQAWRALDNRWHQFRQRTNHALVSFGAEELETSPEGKEQTSRWGLMPAEMYEVENKLVFRLEIPGLDASTLQVTVDGSELVISGEKKLPEEASTNSSKRVFSEIAYGRFERRVALPKRKVAEFNNGANYKQGVLTVEMPFAEETAAAPRSIRVH